VRWKLKASEPGIVLSGVAHVAMLAAGLFAFSSTPPFPDAQEGIPVEIITANQFSEITRGEREAKETRADPKPRAERVAEEVERREAGEAKVDAPAPPRRPADMKVDDKPVEAAQAPPTPPVRPDLEAERRVADAKAAEAKAAEAKAAEAKAAETRAAAAEKSAADARARSEARAAEAKAAAEAQAREAAELARQEAAREAAARQEAARQEAAREAAARARAEARAKAEAEAKAKQEAEARAVADAKARQEAEARRVAEAKAAAESKARAEARAKQEAEARAQRQAAVADKFDAGSIQQMLQSKERSQSSGSTGSEVNRTAALGTATGSAQRLNPSQRDALIGILQDQLHKCWIVPVALQSSPNPPVPSVRIRLNQDGTLAAEPVGTNASGDPLFQVAADSATRAARRCAPLRIPAQVAPFYQDWRDLRVNFNLRDRV
jgi:colicin import membrane protein